MSAAEYLANGLSLLRRAEEEGGEEGDSAKKEFFAAWAIFICILLLIITFFVSYILQMKKVTAIHETVISIFAGKMNHALFFCAQTLTLLHAQA